MPQRLLDLEKLVKNIRDNITLLGLNLSNQVLIVDINVRLQHEGLRGV